jgi:predicted nuclease with TOPRIM domain
LKSIMAAPVLIDLKTVYQPEELARAGFRFEGIGRPDTRSSDPRAALASLQGEVAEISRGKGALQSEQTELQASLQQAQIELRAQEVAIATHEGEFNALQNSQRLLHQKIDTVVYEIQSLAPRNRKGYQRQQQPKPVVCETRGQACQSGRGFDRPAGRPPPAADAANRADR